MKVISHGCTLDCFDTCKFNVYVEDGHVIKIEGDKAHPFTRGFICIKGKKHLERLRHKDRLLRPLKQVNGNWVEIDFSEAVELMAHKLLFYREQFGSQSVLHYCESGSGGILKQIQNVFFNFYGGITTAEGSTCWGAGKMAQKYDFGDSKAHYLEDMLNSGSIFLWGRNPANTSLHLMNMVRQARKKGVQVVVIDPIATDTAAFADEHIRINPATDGALAMAMTKVLIEENLVDKNFIDNRVEGFDEYAAYLSTLDMSYLAAETGVPSEKIRQLATIYGGGKPSAIYPGYGLQRHRNGGNIIRAIDALAAAAGFIGKPGGGVNYINRVYPDILDLDPYGSSSFAKQDRSFSVHQFAEFLKNEDSPPIKALLVSKANPLAQLPNLNKMVSAFEKVEFKVCMDMFMTDTARRCDLVIPCTNTLETEDIVYTSMGNPYIIYNEKAVEPLHPLMDEYFFFMELAQKMGLQGYPLVSKEEYLAKVMKPLKPMGIDLKSIKEEAVTIQKEPVAWRDLNFSTPSGKIELYSEKAKRDGLSPIPVYEGTSVNGLRLITSHLRDSLFSQHFLDVEGIAQAYISYNCAKVLSITEGERVVLRSPNGEIEVEARLTDKVPDNIVHMYTGWWEKHGNPNYLIDNIASEMGGQVAYHDCFVEIIKVDR